MTCHRGYQIWWYNTLFKLSYYQFNITFFYIKLNRINYILLMYDIQNGITIGAKNRWVA
jgi:hypothetical protein